MSNEIVNKLKKTIEKDSINKSSYWKKYLNSNTDYMNAESDLGFGAYLKNINYYLISLKGKLI